MAARRRWSLRGLAAALLCTSTDSFQQEYADVTVAGPALILRPHLHSTGTPFAPGTHMSSELRVGVVAPMHAGKERVAVQVSVWHAHELDELQFAALANAQLEGTEASFTFIDRTGATEALGAGYCTRCHEDDMAGMGTTGGGDGGGAGGGADGDGDGDGDGGDSGGVNVTHSSTTYTHARYCLVQTPSQRTETVWIQPNSTKLVRTNMTIDEPGDYYLGISICAGGGAVAGDADANGGDGGGGGGNEGGGEGGGGGGGGEVERPPVLNLNGYVQWSRFSGKRGSLPTGLLGIIPFYGSLAVLYLLLAVVWSYRMRKYWGYTITLQLTLFLVMLANLTYTVLAFGYYLHLDLDTKATAQKIFGGIYAGLYEVGDPYAVVIATYRFILMSLSRALLTMLCDGLFVLRPLLKQRCRTKAFVIFFTVGELCLLVLQPKMYKSGGRWLHPILQLGFMVVWILWLGYTSWGTWRSLYAEDAADTLHVRWSTPLKQRVYKMVCRAVFLYPLLTSGVYVVFFFFFDSWKWLWLRMVVFDVWMFLVLFPASWHWMPHSTSAQYAPVMEEMSGAAPLMEMTTVALEREGSTFGLTSSAFRLSDANETDALNKDQGDDDEGPHQHHSNGIHVGAGGGVGAGVGTSTLGWGSSEDDQQSSMLLEEEEDDDELIV